MLREIFVYSLSDYVNAYVFGFLIQLGTFSWLSWLLPILKTYSLMARFDKANFSILEHNYQKAFR